MLTNGQDKLFARDAFVAPNNEGVVDEEGENVDLFETLPLRQRERERDKKSFDGRRRCFTTALGKRKGFMYFSAP